MKPKFYIRSQIQYRSHYWMVVSRGMGKRTRKLFHNYPDAWHYADAMNATYGPWRPPPPWNKRRAVIRVQNKIMAGWGYV